MPVRDLVWRLDGSLLFGLLLVLLAGDEIVGASPRAIEFVVGLAFQVEL